MRYRFEDHADAWMGHILNSVATNFRRLTADALEPLGLSPPMLRALEILLAIGPVAQTALGARMHMDRSSIVLLVDRLEALGLARRVRLATDRRNYLIEPTEATRDVLTDAQSRAREVETDLLAPLTAPERNALRTLLAKVLNPEIIKGADR